MRAELNTYSTKAKKWLDILEESVQTNKELLYEQCQELLKIAAEENSNELMGLGYYYFAMYYMEKSEADQVMYCLMEGIKYFPEAGMYEYLARSYNVMGAVAESQDNYILALEYYYTCLSYSETYNMPYTMAMVESNMANILCNMEEYAKAIDLLRKAVRHYGDSKETPYSKWNLMLCNVILGHCYLSQKQYKEAEAEEQKINMLLEVEAGRNPTLAIAVFKAELAYYKGDVETAVTYAEIVIETIRDGASVIEFADSLERMAELLIKMEKYELLLHIQKVVSESSGDSENLSLKAKWYLNCIRCYEKLGMEEEYISYSKTFFKLYRAYSDNGRQTALKAIELRDKLNKIQLRQQDMIALNKELRVTSHHDVMTGMANRAYLNEYLEQCFELAKREDKFLGVELMDIDNFKNYNDLYGHLRGDNCIEKVAMILKGMENDKVFCARYGGDEFMVVYYDMSRDAIKGIAMKIKEKIWQQKIPHENNCNCKIVTVSQGIVYAVPDAGSRVWDFTLKADRLLYQVKAEGRNGILIEEQDRSSNGSTEV